jgi:hypothetical protein
MILKSVGRTVGTLRPVITDGRGGWYLVALGGSHRLWLNPAAALCPLVLFVSCCGIYDADGVWSCPHVYSMARTTFGAGSLNHDPQFCSKFCSKFSDQGRREDDSQER